METQIGKEPGWIVQFSVYVNNALGGVSDLVTLLSEEGVLLLGFALLDHRECAILRVVCNYPELARKLFEKYAIAYCESEVLGVHVAQASRLAEVLEILAQVEIDVFYFYPLLTCPIAGCVLVVGLEDNEFSSAMLETQGIKVLRQSDLIL